MRFAGMTMSCLIVAVAAVADFDVQAMRDAKKVEAHIKAGFGAHFDSGKIEGGTAVYDPHRDLAFWVQGDKIYAVNERAKQAAPDLPPAPDNITYDAVYEGTCRDELAWEIRPAEFGGLARGTSREEVQKIEEAVQSNPKDVWARSRLIQHYAALQFSDKALREKYERHILWLVENAPESAVLVNDGELDPDLNPDAYPIAEKLMKDHVKNTPTKARLLFVASEFFKFSDRPYAIECLNKCVELEPDNPRWKERLAFMHSLDAKHGSAVENPESARKSLEAQEQALELSTEDNRVQILLDLPEMALDAGDLEKAKSYGNELLEKSKTTFLERDGMVNMANTILGRVALKEGDVNKAKEYLLASGKCASSFEFSMFGPNMDLAIELLEKGERDAVVKYLDLCGGFWVKRLTDQWIGQIKGGNDLQIRAVIEEMRSGDAAMNAMAEAMQPVLKAQGMDGAVGELPAPLRNSRMALITLPISGPLSRKLDALYGLPLLALIGILLAVRLGWSRQHLWVLAPLLFIYTVPLALTTAWPEFPQQVFGQSPEELQHLLSTYFGSLAMVWLLSDLLARMRWWGKLPLTVVILGTGGLVGAINFPYRYGVIMMVSTFVVVVTASFAVAGLCCSKRYSVPKFTALLFAFNVVFMLVAWPVVWVPVMVNFYGMPVNEIPMALPHALIIAFVDGVGLFLLLIPFLLVALLVPFYRTQFKRILNLPQPEQKAEFGEWTPQE